MQRTEDDLREVEDRIMPAMEKGRSEFAGMTYEEGIDAMIRWLRGDCDIDEVYEVDG